MPAQAPAAQEHALSLLREMLGRSASFRDGQWAAIQTIVEDRGRLFVVQKTGWGKSIVYFIATRMLRDTGAGPTLLISPPLSLMRNQLDMAHRIGIRALSVNSTNAEQWDAVDEALRRDECDLLMVSPERLGNERFQSSTLRLMRRGIGLFVVDEAHCISDWGHDFRPDYRRILNVLRLLPEHMPILATTATANNRVIEDVRQQLGPKLSLIHGPMRRHSLRLQNVELPRAEQRLAWLAEHVPQMSGSGIVYCLTIDDCDRVAGWLRERGMDAASYHAGLDDEHRDTLERRLLTNDVKALVATVALGMGFDKPDLGFVVHYQRPGSVIAYYQQIGRAGRAVSSADAVLLAAVSASGHAIGIIADDLTRTIRDPEVREAIENGQLSIASASEHYTSAFTIARAMERNAFIYTLAEAAVIVSAGEKTGGTWDGAQKNLKRRWVPMFIRDGEGVPLGNSALVKAGAHPLHLGQLTPEFVRAMRYAELPSAANAKQQATLSLE